MSLKDNINAVKEELGAEEQFLESVIKAEGFWKKYKKIIITLLVILSLAVAYKLISDYIKKSNIEESNIAYAKLLSDPSDKDALNTLKSKNPRLYDLYLFKESVKSKDISKLNSLKSSLKDPVLKDLLTYQSNSISQKDLDSYSLKEGAILKELALYESAYLLLKSGKIKEADKKLDMISQQSPLYNLAQNLKNYRGNKKK